MDTQILHRSLRSSAVVTYSRSGGPGGQNVNKVNTKATVRLPLGGLRGLSDPEQHRLRTILASRLSMEGTELVIQCDEERSQGMNQEKALARMEILVISAAKLPKKRRPTKPTRASREARLVSKKLQGRKKQTRSHPLV
jgi:ribosome-associated protein